MANFLNKMLGWFGLVDEDEDYDDDDYDEDDFEEDEAPRKSRKKSFRYDDDDDDEPVVARSERRASNVLSYSNKKNTKSNNTMAVRLIKPTSLEEEREIANILNTGRAVLLNLEDVDSEIATRIFDFASGACYAVGGTLQPVSSYIFIVTPSSIDVEGDFNELANQSRNPSNTNSQLQFQQMSGSRYRF